MKIKCGCPKKNQRYSEKYDAYYCKVCNKWLESKCDGENCDFCKDRPKKPMIFTSENMGVKKE